MNTQRFIITSRHEIIPTDPLWAVKPVELGLHSLLVEVLAARSGEFLCILEDKNSTKRRKISHFLVPKVHLEIGVAGLCR